MTATTNTMSSGTSSPHSNSKSGFIIGPLADLVLIIGAPLISLVIAGSLFSLQDSAFTVSIGGTSRDLRQVFVTVFINAHLFLVYFRSHANEAIFRQYPWRFTVVPLVVFVAGGLSPAALGITGLIVVWWDVYHSSLQTFGFGRIYDAKMKNDPAIGRRLDYWMNLLVYAGPVLAGAHFIQHIEISMRDLEFLATGKDQWSELFLQRTPDFLLKHQTYLAAAILSVGIPFVAYYFYSYYALSQKGYRVSWQKVWLMVITSTVSIYCWGFHSFIDAFWVMNFFHALQYFAIVGFAEHENLSRVFRATRFSHGAILAMIWVIGFCFCYGLWSSYFASGSWSISMTMTTSIMHFWYDGFIWSVKKKQV